MSDWKPFDYDPATGVRTWFSSDEENGGQWHFKREQDVAPILDRNKEAQAETWDKRSEMWHAAHIPTFVMYEWATKHGVEFWNPAHKDGVKRLLNSDEYRWCRVKNFII